MKKNNLPKYWVVKADKSNPDWKKVVAYLNKTYNQEWSGRTPNCYYGYDDGNKFGGTNYYYDITNFKNTPVILTIEEFVEMTEGNVLPEYAECTSSKTDGFTVGKIYTLPNSIDNNGDRRTVNILNGHLWEFKASTKEAFDKQHQVEEFSIGTYVMFLQDYGNAKKGDVDEIILDSYNKHKQFITCKKQGLTTRESDWVKWFATKEEATKFSKTLTKPKETMRKITHTQAQSIIDIACSAWKNRLFDYWGKNIVLKHNIVISEKNYQEMREACTQEQNELFDVIFGKESKFKIGDWVYIIDGGAGAKGADNLVGQITEKTGRHGMLQSDEGINIDTGKDIWRVHANAKLRPATKEEIAKAKYIPEGTPCLVRDESYDPWKFTYSLGNGKFQSISGVELSWHQVKVLDMNNLPKY